jgi:hypothetical protein
MVVQGTPWAVEDIEARVGQVAVSASFNDSLYNSTGGVAPMLSRHIRVQGGTGDGAEAGAMRTPVTNRLYHTSGVAKTGMFDVDGRNARCAIVMRQRRQNSRLRQIKA